MYVLYNPIYKINPVTSKQMFYSILNVIKIDINNIILFFQNVFLH
jgi:hypothetical protein